MALNSRQKRTRKRKLALALLAKSRNQPMVATEGRVRAVWDKTLPPVANIRTKPWEGSGKKGKVTRGKVTPLPKPLYRADGLAVKGPVSLTAPHAPLGPNVPRERIKATLSAASIAKRKREGKWGVKADN